MDKFKSSSASGIDRLWFMNREERLTAQENYFSYQGFTILDIPTEKAVPLMDELWKKLTGQMYYKQLPDIEPTQGELVKVEESKRIEEMKKLIWDLIALYKELEFNRGGVIGIPYTLKELYTVTVSQMLGLCKKLQIPL